MFGILSFHRSQQAFGLRASLVAAQTEVRDDHTYLATVNIEIRVDGAAGFVSRYAKIQMPHREDRMFGQNDIAVVTFGALDGGTGDGAKSDRLRQVLHLRRLLFHTET